MYLVGILNSKYVHVHVYLLKLLLQELNNLLYVFDMLLK